MEGDKQMIEFELKPSSCVEAYFVHKCERNLFYGGLKKGDRRDFDLKDQTGTGSTVAARAGEEWEEYVAGELIPPERLYAHIEDKNGRRSYKKYTYPATLKELRKIADAVSENRETVYLYQGCLKASDSFKKAWFKFDESLCNGENGELKIDIPVAYPDLIRADWSEEQGRVLFSIVDIKLARHMKLSHKVQVALYVKLLESVIDDHNGSAKESDRIDAGVNKETAYLWNGDQEHERPFELKEEEALLENFFDMALPDLVGKISTALANGTGKSLKDELKKCVKQKCEWCENYRQCMEELKAQESIKLIPYLSEYAQVYAESLDAPKTMHEFAEYISAEENKETLSSNRSWDLILNDGVTLDVQKRAVPYPDDFNAVREIGYSWKRTRSLTMPKWQDVIIMLTAQKYAGDNRVYALGMYTSEYERNESEAGNGNTDNRGAYNDSFEAFVAGERSDESYIGNVTDFINALYEKLADYDSGNGNTGRKVQAYVMDSYELMNLEEALYEALDRVEDDEMTEKIISVLLWLQGDRVVDASEEQPEDVSEYPVVVIGAELRKLVSLPLPVAYRLPEVVNALNVYAGEGMQFNRTDYRLYFDALSNTMRSDAIHAVWKGETSYGENEVSVEGIKEHIKKRLASEAGIVKKLQGEGRREGKLVRTIGSFKLPGRTDYQNRLLRKWFFEVKNESLYQYHQIRQARLQGVEAAMKTGDVIRMRLTEVYDYQNDAGYPATDLTFTAGENIDVIRDEWFSMICAKSPEDLYGYEDYKYPELFIRRNVMLNVDVGILNFLRYERAADYIKITGTLSRGNITDDDEGSEFYVSLRYTDLNNAKVFDTLGMIDAEGENINKGRLLLERPEDIRTLTTDLLENDYSDRQLYYSRMDGFDFTDSQRRAFKHLYEKRLTVLQGPPGTGKSDFIARAIITLCRYYKAEENRSLRVLVTANSHAAIENVLAMVRKKLGAERDISLYKASRLEDETIANVGIVSDDPRYGTTVYEKMRTIDASRPLVLGSTVWSCAKMRSSAGVNEYFDLIIIDEASQLRVMDAMLALCMGSVALSRYLLVGDDDQLPAIIQGRYGKDSDRAYEYGSVFSYYRAKALDNEDDRLMLEDNFRMNEIILRYSAEKIYGRDYTSFGGRDGAVATRHLNYEEPEGELDNGDMPWLSYVLDDFNSESGYWPLVFCRITGGTLKQQEDAERSVVAELTRVIRMTVPAESEEAFWRGNDNRDGVLGIVSPHHSHIEKLKDKISAETGMDRDNLYIGTVDKLQGQQRESIIVSYGVTDLESAVTEGEFIFNRNRLNVALTRAKCKSITVFSEVLTVPSSTMLDTDDDDMQKGIDFVCGLLPFMKKEEEDTEISSSRFELNDDVSIEVYRKRMKP